MLLHKHACVLMGSLPLISGTWSSVIQNEICHVPISPLPPGPLRLEECQLRIPETQNSAIPSLLWWTVHFKL